MKTYGLILLAMLLAWAFGAILVFFFGSYGIVGFILLWPLLGVVSVNRSRKRQQAATQVSSDWHLIYVILAEDHFGNRRYGTLIGNNTNRVPDASERVIIGPAIVGNGAEWYTTDEAALSGMISKYRIDPYDSVTWDGVWPRLGDRFPIYLP